MKVEVIRPNNTKYEPETRVQIIEVNGLRISTNVVDSVRVIVNHK